MIVLVIFEINHCSPMLQNGNHQILSYNKRITEIENQLKARTKTYIKMKIDYRFLAEFLSNTTITDGMKAKGFTHYRMIAFSRTKEGEIHQVLNRILSLDQNYIHDLAISKSKLISIQQWDSDLKVHKLHNISPNSHHEEIFHKPQTRSQCAFHTIRNNIGNGHRPDIMVLGCSFTLPDRVNILY